MAPGENVALLRNGSVASQVGQQASDGSILPASTESNAAPVRGRFLAVAFVALIAGAVLIFRAALPGSPMRDSALKVHAQLLGAPTAGSAHPGGHGGAHTYPEGVPGAAGALAGVRSQKQRGGHSADHAVAPRQAMAPAPLANNASGAQTPSRRKIATTTSPPDCRTVTDESDDPVCYKEVHWAMYDGISNHPEWYPNLTTDSAAGEFQDLVHSAAPDKCPKPCRGKNSACAPPTFSDDFGSCRMPKGSALMSFYMYRAQSPADYPIENINMADLAGVMWYLHREIVESTPRKYEVTRILRYKVTMKSTEKYVNKYKKQFGGFVAFDAGSAPDHSASWEEYGYNVGCQVVGPQLYNYVSLGCTQKESPACNYAKWYSLPGPCPDEEVREKDDKCMAQFPGGRCKSANVTGEPDCTYYAEPAGSISLDELEGIEDYDSFWIGTNDQGGKVPNGNMEYNYTADRGVNMSFWDGRLNKKKCRRRMEAAQALFQEKFPDFPASLPDPWCS